MPQPLLDRQIRLLAYLSSAAAIFGGEGHACIDPALRGVDPALRGIDPLLLGLEARFSHAKRMRKIIGALPRTFQMLGDEQGIIVREFTAACPPAEIGRIENARQFYDFLVARWQRYPGNPAYLPDVAACEITCAELRARRDDPQALSEDNAGRAPPGAIRRPSWVTLRRCDFNIRSIFEPDTGVVVPPKRDTRLAISMPPDAEQPQIFEVNPAVFDLLSIINDWTEPPAFGETQEAEQLITDLASRRLLEVQR